MSKITAEELFVDVQEGSLYVKKWLPEQLDDLTPIILLHDSLGSVDLWRDFPEQLARALSRVVIAYDRLGFGRSSASKTPASQNFIDDEAVKYFPQIKTAAKFEQYLLFGHSVGGAMSITIAANDSDCVGVITEAAQAFVEDLTIKGIKDAQVVFQQPGQINRLARWHGEKATWVLSAWIDVWLSADFASWSLESVIGKVVCPVLALHGEKDEFGSAAFPQFIASRTAGEAKMILLKDCGHVPHKEYSEEVINNIELFLKDFCVG